jgi:hypothetical protein
MDAEESRAVGGRNSMVSEGMRRKPAEFKKPDEPEARAVETSTTDAIAAPEYLEFSAMEKCAVGKFPSLKINGKRNLTKRRKRDKAIPMHGMTTATMMMFKAYHFTPLLEWKSEEVNDESSTSSSNTDVNESESGVAPTVVNP